MRTEPKLLPCPFCGDRPVLIEHESHAHSEMIKALVPDLPDHPGSWSIECCDVGMIKATCDEVVTSWNRRTAVRPTSAALRVPLDDHTQLILGRPNFSCIRIASQMRELGHEIESRAESEQAAVIHMMLNMYLEYGPAWQQHCRAFLAGPRPRMGNAPARESTQP